jgi:hypothetical protein
LSGCIGLLFFFPFMCLNIVNNQFCWDNPQKTLMLATVVLGCPENLLDSGMNLLPAFWEVSVLNCMAHF